MDESIHQHPHVSITFLYCPLAGNQMFAHQLWRTLHMCYDLHAQCIPQPCALNIQWSIPGTVLKAMDLLGDGDSPQKPNCGGWPLKCIPTTSSRLVLSPLWSHEQASVLTRTKGTRGTEVLLEPEAKKVFPSLQLSLSIFPVTVTQDSFLHCEKHSIHCIIYSKCYSSTADLLILVAGFLVHLQRMKQLA